VVHAERPDGWSRCHRPGESTAERRAGGGRSGRGTARRGA
jgi:hypothetical protein